MPTKASSWTRRGFLIEEAVHLSKISRDGARAPYILAMRRRRHSLLAHAARYDWTRAEYRRRILADYTKTGLKPRWHESYSAFFRRAFWDYFAFYKDNYIPRAPEEAEWESPPRKKRVRHIKGEPRRQYSKRQMLKRDISEIYDKIDRAIRGGNQSLRRELEYRVHEKEHQLELLGGE